MSTTSTIPFPRLMAPARSKASSCSSLSTHRPSRLYLPSGSLSIRRRFAAASKDTDSNKGQEQEPSMVVDGDAKPPEEKTVSGEKTSEEVAAELKEVMRARKDAEGGAGTGWWNGVLQEMSEIEWPAAGKVLGTTGVVLGVIAGSTAALLSVNAILAELSDRIFAGRGLQDFF